MGAWTARQIWKTLDAERRREAGLALFEDERLSREERLAALADWLRVRGMRANYFERQPRAKRAEMLASGGMTEEAAQQLILSFHLVNKVPLLSAFLDALGIKHSGGLIEEDFEPPSAERISEVRAKLVESFPDEEVDTYFRALSASDPLSWSGVVEVIDDPA